MLDILSSFLITSQVPDTEYATFERANNLFDEFDLTTADFIYEQIIVTYDDRGVDAADVMTKIYNATREMLFDILQSHSIVIDPELSLGEVVDVVQALWNLQDREEVDEILSIAQGDEDPSMKLARLFSIASSQSEEYYLFKILAVNPSFFTQVAELYATRQTGDDNQEYLDLSRQCRRDLKQYLDFLKVADIRTTHAIRAGVRFGLEMENYIRLLAHVWPILPENNIAVELYAIFLISAERKGNVNQMMELAYGQVMEDAEKISRVRRVVANILSGFARHQEHREHL